MTLKVVGRPTSFRYSDFQLNCAEMAEYSSYVFGMTVSVTSCQKRLAVSEVTSS